VEKQGNFAPKPLSSLLLTLILLFLPCSLLAREADALSWREAREGLDDAITLYGEGKFAEAAEAFQSLRGLAPEGELDPDALRLAEGTAQLKSGNATEAMAALEGIEGFDASSLQARQRLLEGNAAYQIARQAIDQQDHAQAKTSAERAQESFRNALTVDPENEAAAHNLELTQRFIETLPEPPPQENQDQQEQEEQENDQEQESQDQQNQNSGEEDQQDQQNQQEQQDSREPQEESSPEQESGENQQDQEDQEQRDQSQGGGQEPQSEQDPSDSSTPSSPSDQEAQDMPLEQVEQLLDNYDEQERRQRRQFLQRNARPIPVEKDW
jgi:Ca-activated chloride channel family protein